MSAPAPLRIAVIGAGSAQFLPELADFCALDGIGRYEVALVDTHPTRAVVAEQFGRAVAAEAGVAAEVTAHTDRRAAIAGAHLVVVSIGVGMQESIQPDFEIPARYGVRQTVADTLGIGAIVRILRTAPVLADIARDIAECSPAAILANVTNPMAMCCMALHRMVPEVRTVGLCHSTWQTAAKVADVLGVPIDELDFDGAGVNHQVFLTRLAHRGEDLYPRLRELARSEHRFAAGVRADLLRRLGYFVTESSKHNAEYVPWYLPWDDQVERFALPVNPYWERRANNAEWFAHAVEIGAGRARYAMQLVPSGEYAPQIARSLVDGVERRLWANVPNRVPGDSGARLVDELPEWGVVEVPARCDADGVHPEVASPLPPQCAAVNRRYLDVCDLAVRAIVEGRRDHVHHAALLDPNTSATLAPAAIEAMVDELLDAHQAAGRLPEVLWR